MTEGRGRGACANLAGTPEAARLGLWPGTAAPAKDPGLALASATLQRGAFLGDAPGTQRGGQGPSLQAWKSVGRWPRCSGSKSPLGMARPAVLASGVGGLTEKLLAGWELGRTRVLLSVANLAEGAVHGDGYPVSFRWNFTMLSSGERL